MFVWIKAVRYKWLADVTVEGTVWVSIGCKKHQSIHAHAVPANPACHQTDAYIESFGPSNILVEMLSLIASTSRLEFSIFETSN
jgi:hypothetical protein